MARPMLPTPPQEHRARSGGAASQRSVGVAAALIAVTKANGRRRRAVRGYRCGI